VTGVRKGCIGLPLPNRDGLCNEKKTNKEHNFGIVWGQRKLADFDFAATTAPVTHRKHYGT